VSEVEDFVLIISCAHLGQSARAELDGSRAASSMHPCTCRALAFTDLLKIRLDAGSIDICALPIHHGHAGALRRTEAFAVPLSYPRHNGSSFGRSRSENINIQDGTVTRRFWARSSFTTCWWYRNLSITVAEHMDVLRGRHCRTNARDLLPHRHWI
jgi:hypothetical protein